MIAFVRTIGGCEEKLAYAFWLETSYCLEQLATGVCGVL